MQGIRALQILENSLRRDFWWFRTNVVSQLADRLKIRTNRITSELAEVRAEAALLDAQSDTRITS